jgi:hypothetical protein
MARYAWGVVNCVFSLDLNLKSVNDLSRWAFTLPMKARSLVAVGVSVVIWALWKTRNATCFRNVFPYDPTSVITRDSHWLMFWSGLQKPGRREILANGAKVLLRVAAEIFSTRRGWAPVVLRIAGWGLCFGSGFSSLVGGRSVYGVRCLIWRFCCSL